MPCTTAHKQLPHDPGAPSVHRCSTMVRLHGGSSESFHPVAPKNPSRIRRSVDADPLLPRPTAPSLCHPPAVCPTHRRQSGSASRFLCLKTLQPRAADTRSDHSYVQSSPRSFLRSPVISAAFGCPPVAVSATAHPGFLRSPSSFASLRTARAGSLSPRCSFLRSHPTSSAPAPSAAKVDREGQVRCSAAQFPNAVAAFPFGCVLSKTR